MEVRELLDAYEFPGDDIPVISGFCPWRAERRRSMGRQDHGTDELVDEYIPTPERDHEKPFLMPIEDVFSITGRGTVVTGRVERGSIKVGDPIDIIGMQRREAVDDGYWN